MSGEVPSGLAGTRRIAKSLGTQASSLREGCGPCTGRKPTNSLAGWKPAFPGNAFPGKMRLCNPPVAGAPRLESNRFIDKISLVKFARLPL